MSVALGENKGVYLHSVLCSTSLLWSRSAEPEPGGCRFNSKSQLASFIRVSSRLFAAFGRVLSARVGTNISSDFIVGKAQGEEQKKNNERQRLSLLKEERVTVAKGQAREQREHSWLWKNNERTRLETKAKKGNENHAKRSKCKKLPAAISL